MFKTFNQDRKIIENKYHNVNEPFNSFSRWNYHGYPYDETTGLSDEQMENGLNELKQKIQGDSNPIQKAKYFKYVLENTRIDVNEHDYFVGIWSWSRPLMWFARWYHEVELEYPEVVELINDYNSSGFAYGGLDFDHTVPDWDSLLELGFKGIVDRLHANYNELLKSGNVTQKQTDIYNACVTVYESIINLIDRLYNYALTKTHAKAKTYAECLKNLRDGAPTNTYEALQLIFLYFFIGEHIDNYQVRSLGFGLDASLYPFYKKDLESGKFTKEEIAEFLAYFLMQFSAIGNYWNQPMYLAGRDKNGNSKVTDLSRLILQVYDTIDIYNPKIQIKISKNTPKDFVYQVLKMIQQKNKSLVLCNDEMIELSLLKCGATKEEALDSGISGCYEYFNKNKHVAISGFGANALKPVSLVFDNGYDAYSKKQLSIKTGEVENFKSFDEFYNAYLKHLEYLLKKLTKEMVKMEAKIGGVNPSLMFTGANRYTAKNMTDALDGGIPNASSIALSGLGTAVDALMAVYELVFEKKVTTLLELKTALLSNWEGYEKLRLKALNCSHKYGVGDHLADRYAKDIVDYVYNVLHNSKNARGYAWELEMHSARAFIIHGKKTLATPDGRKAGEETSKNASAHPGMDKNGVTALINSVTSIDTTLTTVGFCLDVALLPSTVKGEEGLDVLYSIMRTYMDKGGHSIQFNIHNSETLKDAQLHPEKYQNLQVRVCGWNVLWNNMPKVEQDAYILRAENISQ